jgi:phosphoglycolate phosphatase-like HAD superfamily hydrolase
VFIGDTERDLRAGESARVRTILLDYDYNRGLTDATRVADLTEAADLILGARRR